MTLTAEITFDLTIAAVCMLCLGAFRVVMSFVERVHPLATGVAQRPRPDSWVGQMVFVYVLNAVLVVGMFYLWHVVDFQTIGLLATSGFAMGGAEQSIGSLILYGAIFWVAYSCFDGFMHYWRHCSDFLWGNVHQVHHDDPAMNVSTTYWRCWQEIAFDTVALMIFGGLVIGVSWPVLVIGMSFELLAQLIHHTNFRSPRWLMATLGRFIQLPEHHRYHHAIDLHHAYYWTIMPFNVLFDWGGKLVHSKDVGTADIHDVGERKTGFANPQASPA